MVWMELCVLLACIIVGARTMLEAISFDQTGTTRIGKYVLNHSFMLPGLKFPRQLDWLFLPFD
jgi:anaerobic C4-dicarboxylate transporter